MNPSHETELNTGRIHDKSLAHSMANAVNTERNNKILYGPAGPNAWVDDTGLTAGVVELIGKPGAMNDFVKEHLNSTLEENTQEHPEGSPSYKQVGPEVIGRIAASLATTTGEKSQSSISQKLGASPATISKAMKQLVAGGYVNDANLMISANERPVRYLVPTKKFARELASNPTWQRAVLASRLAEKLNMPEDDAIAYALRRVLEEESTDKDD